MLNNFFIALCPPCCFHLILSSPVENHRRSNMPCMCTQRQYTRAVVRRRRRRSPGGRMLQCPPGLTGASRRSAACGGDGIHAIQGLDSAKANQSGPLASPINLITFFSASSVLGYSWSWKQGWACMDASLTCVRKRSRTPLPVWTLPRDY